MASQGFSHPLALLIWICVFATPIIFFAQALLLRGACFMMDRISPSREIAELPMGIAFGVVVWRTTLSMIGTFFLMLCFQLMVGGSMVVTVIDVGILFLFISLLLSLICCAIALVLVHKMDFASGMISSIVDAILQCFIISLFVSVGFLTTLL